MPIYIVVFFLIFLGLVLILGIDFSPQSKTISPSEVLRGAKRDLIIAKAPGRIERAWQYWLHLISLAQVPVPLFIILCLLSLTLGTVLGNLVMGDLSLAFFVGSCATPLPLIYIFLLSRKYIKREAEQLEGMMSSVTQAYLASNSIIAAFESYNNMRNKGLDPRLRRITPVDEFLIDVHAINPSVAEGLRKLQAKENNRYFDDWIDMLIRCTRNNELRFGLQPIIKAFNDSKIMQMEAETVTAMVWREYAFVVIMLLGIIPVLRLSNEAWYNILTKTAVGRVLVCVLIAATLGTSFYVLRVTRPLD